MNPQLTEQIGIGVLALVAGISGWVLPYKWNVLRLRRAFARRVPGHVNRLIPKVVGTFLLIAGLGILIATALLGPFT